MLACALERYHLAEGRYPGALADLTPKFIGAIPNDVVSDQPYRYRQDGGGSFVLYSVGWDADDDGGVENWRTSLPKADWVWRYPAF
jgi:hypothetical protein